MIPCCDIDIGPNGSKPRASGDDPAQIIKTLNEIK